MSQIEKLIVKFQNNPNSISVSELKKLLIHKGWKQNKGKGSHINYKMPNWEIITLAPHWNKLKKIYFEKYQKLLFPTKKQNAEKNN